MMSNITSIPTSVWDQLFKILSGQIPNVSLLGLPGYAFFAMPFVIGLILGFLIKKTFKIAIIALIAVAAGLYFGVLTMGNLQTALQKAQDYSPLAMQYAALLFGMLPLGAGLLVGFIIGLKFG